MRRIGLTFMKNVRALLVILGMPLACALAGDDGKTVTPVATPGPFDRGTWEAEGGAGFFGSFSESAAKRTTINYQLEDLRIGWMYDSPRHAGIFRGNDEFLLEAFAGLVTKGPGGYLAGGTPLYRYNFVQPGARWVPYLQIGAGALWNNIYTGHHQYEIGEGFEFTIQGDVGLRYMISDQWSASAEVGYRHISNAGLAYNRNEGLNSLGGLMELSYRFR